MELMEQMQVINNIIEVTGSKKFGREIIKEIIKLEGEGYKVMDIGIDYVRSDSERSNVSIIADDAFSECTYNPVTGEISCNTISLITIEYGIFNIWYPQLSINFSGELDGTFVKN